jgi:hypothetical protein
MQRFDIILNNENDHLYNNMEIINWLNNNHKLINDSKFFIKILPLNYNDLDSDKIDELAKLNINKLPVLIFNNKVYGNDLVSIKANIINLVENHKNTSKNINDDNDDDPELMQNWMLNQMKNQDNDIEDIDMQDEIRKYNNKQNIDDDDDDNYTKKNTNKNTTVAKNTNVPKKRAVKNSDDDLLAKFWENKNITE